VFGCFWLACGGGVFGGGWGVGAVVHIFLWVGVCVGGVLCFVVGVVLFGFFGFLLLFVLFFLGFVLVGVRALLLGGLFLFLGGGVIGG